MKAAKKIATAAPATGHTLTMRAATYRKLKRLADAHGLTVEAVLEQGLQALEKVTQGTKGASVKGFRVVKLEWKNCRPYFHLLIDGAKEPVRVDWDYMGRDTRVAFLSSIGVKRLSEDYENTMGRRGRCDTAALGLDTFFLPKARKGQTA